MVLQLWELITVYLSELKRIAGIVHNKQKVSFELANWITVLQSEKNL